MTLLYILRPGRSQSVPATTGVPGKPVAAPRVSTLTRSRQLLTVDGWLSCRNHQWLVVWNIIFLTFHSVGNVIIPTDFHIFQRDWNHQPDQWGIIEYNKEIPDKFQIIRYYRIILVTWSSRFWRIYKNTYIREKNEKQALVYSWVCQIMNRWPWTCKFVYSILLKGLWCLNVYVLGLQQERFGTPKSY